MITTKLRLTARESDKGKVTCQLRLIGTRADSGTARECEYLEFAINVAVLAISRGARKLQQQARTKPACHKLVGGEA